MIMMTYLRISPTWLISLVKAPKHLCQKIRQPTFLTYTKTSPTGTRFSLIRTNIQDHFGILLIKKVSHDDADTSPLKYIYVYPILTIFQIKMPNTKVLSIYSKISHKLKFMRTRLKVSLSLI